MLSKIFSGLAAGALFASGAVAVPTELKPRASTCNTASNRACWTDTFNINTDYETSVPLTGHTEKYLIEITEHDNWVGPDGVVKAKAMLINGTFPGPTLRANWGDRIEVTVVNKLQVNGTAIHWHGVRQLNNAVHDGVNGVTECPIPPNSSRIYNFLAEQYGTTWYHSHFSAQYGYGTVGSLVIDGPTSLPYEIDLGAYPITDWYYRSADDILEQVHHGGPPPSDNILINGTNKNVALTSGNYAVTKLTPGKRHKLRLINTSVDNVFTVRLQNHTMTVVAEDFVPVNSVTVNELFIGIGQRYDVTIDASQAPGNYWFNVSLSSTNACGTSTNKFPAAIFSYEGVAVANPTDKGVAIPEQLCVDNLDMQPIVQRTAPPATFAKTVGNTLPVQLATEVVNNATNVFWKVNGSSIDIQWDKPTLQYVMEGNSSFPPNLNLIQVPQANQWAYWIIENQSVLPHPIHLHGHDFLILGRSLPPASPFTSTPTPFNPATDTSKLKFNNPSRRDVTMLPANGWVAIAFRTDNPGAWLMHCHIAWHVSFGLGVQFLERTGEIATHVDLPNIVNNCNAWRDFYATSPVKKHDSGL